MSEVDVVSGRPFVSQPKIQLVLLFFKNPLLSLSLLLQSIKVNS